MVFRKPVIFTLGTEYKNLKNHHKIMLSVFSPLITKIVACSSSTYNSLSFFPKCKLHLIRHGVATDTCLDILNQSQSGNRLVNSCIYAGRLIPTKNVDFVIRSFESISSSSQFIVIGEGSSSDHLNSIATSVQSSNPLFNISFKGLLPRDNVREYMSTCQFYVSASNSDGMPISVLESLCLGLIPILSDTKPHHEIVELGFKCFSFTLDSPSSLSSVLDYAFSLSNSELSIMRSHNDSLIHLLSIDRMLSFYRNLYSEAIK